MPRNDFIASNLGINGDVPSEPNFDGLACIDNYEKLLFTSASSQAVLQLGKQPPITSSFTLEFWFMTPSVQKAPMSMLAL